MEYPRHLFKHPGGYGEGPRSYQLAGAASEDEEAALLAKGWHLTKEAAWGVEAPKPPEKTLLDSNATEVEEGLPGLSLEALEALKADETKGKARKGVLAAIDAAIDAALAKDGNGD